ncbi:MAG: hypothetical protein R3D27_02905 [Hyphomicrobiaceae bacterium]
MPEGWHGTRAILAAGLACLLAGAAPAVAQSGCYPGLPCPGQNSDENAGPRLPPALPPVPQAPQSAPRASLLVDRLAVGTWAIGGVSNCGVTRKLYALSAGGDIVTWRNGEGKTFVERVLESSEARLVTRTVSGSSAGKTWTYIELGPARIRVVPDRSSAFIIERCR